MIEGYFADAVAIVLYHIDDERKVWVGLRHGVRPSIYFRKDNPVKAKLDSQSRLTYLELVAGGIEYGDLGTIGIDGRAALEVREEAGFEVEAEEMVSLGKPTFSSPGSGMEKLHYRAVQVDPDNPLHYRNANTVHFESLGSDLSASIHLSKFLSVNAGISHIGRKDSYYESQEFVYTTSAITNLNLKLLKKNSLVLAVSLLLS